MDEHELTARLAVSALTIAANCAAALSENGLLPPLKAKACAAEMLIAADLQDQFRQQQLGPDALPSDFASILQALAQLLAAAFGPV